MTIATPCPFSATVISTITTGRNVFLIVQDEELARFLDRLEIRKPRSYFVEGRLFMVAKSKAHLITYLDAIYCTKNLQT